MSQPSTATVVVHAVDPAKARSWSEALAELGVRVWQVASRTEEAPWIDVILTDQHRLGPEFQEAGWWRHDQPSANPPGVVCVGGEGPADVMLPVEATPREIGLACRLLAQVVQLRRQLHWHEQVRQRLALEAMTDPLTGLPNRRAWVQALEEYKAAGGPFCVAMLDLDHFKPVNDIHGHPVGDRVLQTVAAALRDSLRGSDFVARLGGDEFGLLLSISSPAAAASIVERVRRRLPAALGEAGLPVVTASAGYSGLPAEGAAAPLPSPETALAAADEALQQAKVEGRDRVVAKPSQPRASGR